MSAQKDTVYTANKNVDEHPHYISSYNMLQSLRSILFVPFCVVLASRSTHKITQWPVIQMPYKWAPF